MNLLLLLLLLLMAHAYSKLSAEAEILYLLLGPDLQQHRLRRQLLEKMQERL